MDGKENDTNVDKIESWDRLEKSDGYLKVKKHIDRATIIGICAHCITIVCFVLGKCVFYYDSPNALAWFLATLFWLGVGLFCNGMIFCWHLAETKGCVK